MDLSQNSHSHSGSHEPVVDGSGNSFDNDNQENDHGEEPPSPDESNMESAVQSEQVEALADLETWLHNSRSERISAYVSTELANELRQLVEEGQYESMSIALDAAIRAQIKYELENNEDYSELLDLIPSLEDELTRFEG